ncbi:uncharacterized protein LOC121778681 [Salvia splendens]|uniref:uncharacterized protein LOC121778681 n=1 Tax=Salvia splendens TaxID=180675 RepID=UPI001C26AD90|nr:uncharacterized protein LOC121778681 [Salvia splendens]
MDLLAPDNPPSTPLETQFTSMETFSLEELGLSLIRDSPTDAPTATGRRGRRSGRGRGRGRGITSPVPMYGGEAGAAEVGEWSIGKKRIVWSKEECIALAKAWISVVEDPYVGANQHIDRMWWRINQSFLQFKPPGGKPHNGEQCRKQWERLRRQLSRFADIYTNSLRSTTSVMSTEDVKLLSHHQFIDTAQGFEEFKYWEVYIMVQTSAKFTAGVESGWPKQTKISASEEYSSSVGFHELPPAEAEFPTPTSLGRRRGLVCCVKKTASC